MGYTPYAATPEKTVREALRLSGVGPSSVVYDVGAGDGRVAVEAAKLGAKVVAIEVDSFFEKLIKWNLAREGVAADVWVVDAAEVDYFPATHVISSVRAKEAEEKIVQDVRPGTKVVTFGWEIGGLGNPIKESVNLLGYRYYFAIKYRNFEDVQSLYPLTVEELITKMKATLEYQWAGPIFNSVFIYTKE